MSRRSALRSVAALAAVLGTGSLSLLAKHPLPGPHFVHCEVSGDLVRVSWDHLGVPPETRAELRRDGELIALLDNEDFDYEDRGVPPGLHVYTLVIDLEALEGVEWRCEAIVEGPPPLPSFRRGDANDDGEVNMSDGIFILDFLFRGGEDPICHDAADVDRSVGIDITDAVRVFQVLFLGEGEIPPPFPDCGRVEVGIGCLTNACNR
jgi:hypothetical protein